MYQSLWIYGSHDLRTRDVSLLNRGLQKVRTSTHSWALPVNFLRQDRIECSKLVLQSLSPLLRHILSDKRARFETGMDSRRSCIRTTRRGDRLCKYYASGAIVRSTCVLCSASGLCKYTVYANLCRGLNACS